MEMGKGKGKEERGKGKGKGEMKSVKGRKEFHINECH